MTNTEAPPLNATEALERMHRLADDVFRGPGSLLGRRRIHWTTDHEKALTMQEAGATVITVGQGSKLDVGKRKVVTTTIGWEVSFPRLPKEG